MPRGLPFEPGVPKPLNRLCALTGSGHGREFLVLKNIVVCIDTFMLLIFLYRYAPMLRVHLVSFLSIRKLQVF